MNENKEPEHDKTEQTQDRENMVQGQKVYEKTNASALELEQEQLE